MKALPDELALAGPTGMRAWKRKGTKESIINLFVRRRKTCAQGWFGNPHVLPSFGLRRGGPPSLTRSAVWQYYQTAIEERLAKEDVESTDGR